jgi:hypothetical protein
MSTSGFTTVRTVGGLLPPDVLAGIVSGRDLPGMTANDYHLKLGITPREDANRSWATLLGAWRGYRAALEALPNQDKATTLTREKWLFVLLRELGFGHRPSAGPSGGVIAEERSFPISHVADDVPMHLLGWTVGLDVKTPKVAGAADRAPHAMVQELLNRSDDHLWAILSNGRLWRLLRDSTSIVGAAYVEFDLEAMFDGEVYSDFVLFYLCCHRSRFLPPGGDEAELGINGCWLERWRSHAAETGTRALAELRSGVRNAIVALGSGFTTHPANDELRRRLETEGVDEQDLKRSLLRVVYRMIFCFVAEDRGLLLDPSPAAAPARKRYNDWFSTARLRRIAHRRRGGRHTDQWQALSIVFNALGAEEGHADLALIGLGGLFERGAADLVDGCVLSNESLLTAIRSLSIVQPAGGPKRVIDYRNLGSEELGSVYESLLELVPRYDKATRQFSLEEVSGNERKKTGSYYTPVRSPPACSTPHSTPCWTPPADPAISSLPRPAGSPCASPEHAAKTTNPPPSTNNSPWPTSSTTASTASTSTTWPPNSPKSASGSKPWSPANPSGSSTPTSASATRYLASRRRYWQQECPMMHSHRSVRMTARSPPV